ncbi:uncharacterized protein OCT59_016473 [Rhizophagus irregularis]|uniref:uncharacterized protein n=1 Tax=Rhizophagus irregularis TaxID=588596 RepID=UPI00331C83D8|nr:hypothetical protein OCT59_016473 [Rhizophagus irregularis]
MIYSNEYYIEELYFPRARYFINKSTMLKLKRHYFTAYDTIIDEEDGEEVSENGMKYGRLKIRNGKMIGSKWGRRNKDFTNTNYTVAISW